MNEPNTTPFVNKVNTRYLETLLGYNARRASLVIVNEFLERMAVFDLRIVDFSVLSLITHNPGITSKQLCNTLGVQAPNLVSMVNALEERQLIKRLPHPNDGRAMGLHLTDEGEKMMRSAEKIATQLEMVATAKLSDDERKTLVTLLKKIYK
jgi:DNA-binding MarR family transcriptional regulator